MSKRESIIRYSLIINKLRKQPATLAEFSNYFKLESELQGYNFEVDKRTFIRDKDDIREIYKIDIQYDKSHKHYYINSDYQPEFSERILEAFDILNALNISERLSNIVHLEKKRPQGTEKLYDLLHAVNKKVQIKFTHQKYWEVNSTNRIVEPYALKEFKYRWYLIAKDLKDEKVKTFALDRLTDLEITKRKSLQSDNYDVNEHFRNCFGIISPDDTKLQYIILSFDPFQGRYIKSLPLHESQEILIDTDDELKIKLKMYITHDFIMELLSFGSKVKVVEPKSLISEIKATLTKTIELY